jgi:ABC-type polar amino acid transport system ATPase subunit
LTLLLTAIDPNEITSKMSITAKKPENKIMTLYAETRDAGFFTTTEYKLLFVNKRTLQVQETTKYPFMKARTKVQTLTFLN